MSHQCLGETISGDRCRRHVRGGDRYCPAHNVSPSVALPSYVSVTNEDRFWLFTVESPTWTIGDTASVTIRSTGSGVSYKLYKYVSEGTYGAVYFAKRAHDGALVAIKIFKQVYRKNSLRPPVEFDFMKEFYMNRAVAERVARGHVVDMLDSFFVKIKQHLHGCLVMEKMDGCLLDYFEKKSGKVPLSVWVSCLRDVALAVSELHSRKIYHLDVKPGNVLYKITDDGPKAKLVDMGLSCYVGGTPIVPCVATGTYIPPEWRRNDDPKLPTFASVTDPDELEMGECYAICTTFHRLFRHVRRNQSPLHDVVALIELGHDPQRHNEVRLNQLITALSY